MFKRYCFFFGKGYLFEGHLTLDPEPPQPQWLVQSNLMNAFASAVTAESSQGSTVNVNTVENAANVLEQLINHLDTVIPEVFYNLLDGFVLVYRS